MTSGMEGRDQPCILLTVHVCSTYSKNEEMLLEAPEQTGAHRQRVSRCPNRLSSVPLRRCRAVNYGTRNQLRETFCHFRLLMQDGSRRQGGVDSGEASRQSDTHGALRWRWPPVCLCSV